MRAPTPTERRLLILFLSAAFLAVNAAGFKLWQDAVARQKTAIETAKTAIAEAETWLITEEAIGEIGRNPPPPPDIPARDASSNLLNTIRTAASRSGLTIVEEALPQPPQGLTERAVVARIRLSGPFAGCVKFLYDVQQPGAWRSIEQAVIKADPAPQNVLAEMEIRQYFAPSNNGGQSTPTPPTEIE